MYTVFVRYKRAEGYKFGAATTKLDEAAQRLAMHADNYGSDPFCAGFIFDVDNQAVLAEFTGGISPVHFRAFSFCARCLETFEVDERGGHLVCETCRPILFAEIEASKNG